MALLIMLLHFLCLTMVQMLSALTAYLGLAAECPSKEVKDCHSQQQARPLLVLPTWPALKEVLSLLPKGELVCIWSALHRGAVCVLPCAQRCASRTCCTVYNVYALLMPATPSSILLSLSLALNLLFLSHPSTSSSPTLSNSFSHSQPPPLPFSPTLSTTFP